MFDSPKDALKSLSVDEREDQLVRLIQIADNKQLKAMLEVGKELCQPKAALYLRVAESCPFYYMTWEEGKPRDEMKIHVSIPKASSGRQSLLQAFENSKDGTKHPVCAKVGRGRRSSNAKEASSRRPLHISPDEIVVGGPGFESTISTLDKDKGSEDEEEGSESDGAEGEEDM